MLLLPIRVIVLLGSCGEDDGDDDDAGKCGLPLLNRGDSKAL